MMKKIIPTLLAIALSAFSTLIAQTTEPTDQNTQNEAAHSVLPADAVIDYLPNDTAYFNTVAIPTTNKIQFTPLINFFFRPEATINYKEAGMPIDTGQFNFFLRGDFGGRLSLPKNIDFVFNLQSYGVYTRSFGPLDNNITLYEAYVDMKALDKKKKMSLRFGRMSLGKYGSEMLIGDNDFTNGRNFESVRYRYKAKNSTSDLIWVQLYQLAPNPAGFPWNHPLFVANLNTFNFSDAVNFDANLPFLIDQFNSGYNTSVFMPDLRFFGRANAIRYSAEVIYQTGSGKDVIDESITANINSLATEISLGYFAENNKMSFEASYYLAQGDDDPTDNNLKSYNVLWQNEHRRFGYIDAFRGSNVQATTIHLDWKLGRLLSTGIHLVMANVLQTGDRSTGIATIPSLEDLSTTSTSIGSGGDWYLNYFFNHYLNFQFSASVFSPGEYFTAVNGIEDPMVRLYIMMAARI